MKETTGRDEEDNDNKTVSQTCPLSHHPSLHAHPRSHPRARPCPRWLAPTPSLPARTPACPCTEPTHPPASTATPAMPTPTSSSSSRVDGGYHQHRWSRQPPHHQCRRPWQPPQTPMLTTVAATPSPTLTTMAAYPSVYSCSDHPQPTNRPSVATTLSPHPLLCCRPISTSSHGFAVPAY